MVEYITFGSETMAIILYANFKKNGIHFLTPDNFSQQLGYMNHPAGHLIDPHFHNLVPREVKYTNEVLYIKSGKIRVDFYNLKHSFLESRVLNKGDVLLLASGGHGFCMLEDSEIVEIKQGPYTGDGDKTRFMPIEKNKHE
jgi:hypothetical protein